MFLPVYQANPLIINTSARFDAYFLQMLLFAFILLPLFPGLGSTCTDNLAYNRSIVGFYSISKGDETHVIDCDYSSVVDFIDTQWFALDLSQKYFIEFADLYTESSSFGGWTIVMSNFDVFSQNPSPSLYYNCYSVLLRYGPHERKVTGVSENIKLYKYKAFCGLNSFTGSYRYLVFGFESRSSFNVHEVEVYPTTKKTCTLNIARDKKVEGQYNSLLDDITHLTSCETSWGTYLYDTNWLVVDLNSSYFIASIDVFFSESPASTYYAMTMNNYDMVTNPPEPSEHRVCPTTITYDHYQRIKSDKQIISRLFNKYSSLCCQSSEAYRYVALWLNTTSHFSLARIEVYSVTDSISEDLNTSSSTSENPPI